MSATEISAGAMALSLKSLERYHADAARRVLECAPKLRATLLVAGAVKVIGAYDGCGDSGQIDSLLLLRANGTTVPMEEAQQAQIEGLFYDLLEVRHGGWENNDGAYGEFIWELNNDVLTHQHFERVIDSDLTMHEGLDDLPVIDGEPS